MDLFDFSRYSSTLPEDRWLRFALRLSLVLFVFLVEAVIVIGLAKALGLW